MSSKKIEEFLNSKNIRVEYFNPVYIKLQEDLHNELIRFTQQMKVAMYGQDILKYNILDIKPQEKEIKELLIKKNNVGLFPKQISLELQHSLQWVYTWIDNSRLFYYDRIRNNLNKKYSKKYYCYE